MSEQYQQFSWIIKWPCSRVAMRSSVWLKWAWPFHHTIEHKAYYNLHVCVSACVFYGFVQRDFRNLFSERVKRPTLRSANFFLPSPFCTSSPTTNTQKLLAPTLLSLFFCLSFLSSSWPLIQPPLWGGTQGFHWMFSAQAPASSSKALADSHSPWGFFFFKTEATINRFF